MRNVYFGCCRGVQSLALDIRYHTDDLLPVGFFGKPDIQPLSDRILVRPQTARQGFIDDGHGVGVPAVLLGEQPAA